MFWLLAQEKLVGRAVKTAATRKCRTKLNIKDNKKPIKKILNWY